MDPTMVLKTINYFSPKVRARERPGPFTPTPRTIDKTIVRTSARRQTFGLFWGNGAAVEIFNWVAPSVFTILTEGLP